MCTSTFNIHKCVHIVLSVWEIERERERTLCTSKTLQKQERERERTRKREREKVYFREREREREGVVRAMSIRSWKNLALLIQNVDSVTWLSSRRERRIWDVFLDANKRRFGIASNHRCSDFWQTILRLTWRFKHRFDAVVEQLLVTLLNTALVTFQAPF